MMHFVVGFAIIVGLLAVPATRMVLAWITGIGVVVALVGFVVVSIVNSTVKPPAPQVIAQTPEHKAASARIIKMYDDNERETTGR